MRIPLTHYGRRELIIATAVCGVLAALGAATFAPSAALPAAVWLFVLAFFRDPQRRPDEADALVSPADGTVVDITPLDASGPLGRPGVRIGIFMSVFDVHVNRSPAAGTVVSVRHNEGGFLDARKPEAWERNESATTLLDVPRGGATHRLAIRQVAGLIARRIVTDLKPGQPLAAGERIGMIKFGSRAELMAPAELVGEVPVRIGQHVRGGKTVLIRPPGAEKTI